MLHQELMFRFDEADLVLPPAPESAEPVSDLPAQCRPSGLRLAASIFGNMLLGAALLGGLLVVPILLEHALGYFGLGAPHL